jgi:outer membrane scaffolding protein for murein synthesis (MipA/OmpV family)
LRIAVAPTTLLVLCALVPIDAMAELANGSLLGLGARSRPAYDGSVTQRVEGVPVVRYFGPTLFVRSTQGVVEGGARAELSPGLHAGAQLAYESGRLTKESPFLESHQVSKQGPGASVGLHLEWDHSLGPMPITLLARLRKHIEANRGLQLDLRLSAGLLKAGRFGAGVFLQSTWSDARSADAQFGTGVTTAPLTDLPRYTAGKGWLTAGGGLLWSVDLSPEWVIVGSVEARRLQGSAARSPLAERVASQYLSVGIARQF